MSGQISRRTVAKGALWTAPVISATAILPAMAASSQCTALTCAQINTTLQFKGSGYNNSDPGTAITGWTNRGTTYYNGSSTAAGLSWWGSRNYGDNTASGCGGTCATVSATGNNVISGADPNNTDDPVSGFKAQFQNYGSGKLCLAPNTTYQFCFNYGAVTCRPGPVTILAGVYSEAQRNTYLGVSGVRGTTSGALSSTSWTTPTLRGASQPLTELCFTHTTPGYKTEVFFMFTWTYGDRAACAGDINWNDLWVQQPYVKGC